MSFERFRKFHKPIVLGGLAFFVAALVLFPSQDDMTQLTANDMAAGTCGSFRVLSTNEQRTVARDDFARSRARLAKLSALGGGRGRDVTDDQVWHHLLLLADAEAAGLRISDHDVARQIPDAWKTKSVYDQLWRSGGFVSAREFEETLRESLLVNRWIELASGAERLVDDDEVWLQYRVDHELFDLAALVFEDVPLEEIADPTVEELAAWFEAIDPALRERRFREPARQDIVLAYVRLDADPATLPADKLALVPEPAAEEIELRWSMQRMQLAPDAPQGAPPDEAQRAALVAELRLLGLVTAAREAFQAQEVKDATSFTAEMSGWGLTVQDPQGLLGPDELAALEPIEDASLDDWLRNTPQGGLHSSQSWAQGPTAYVVLVEATLPDRAVTLEDGRDLIVKQWKEERKDRRARDAKEALLAAARAAPEAAAALEGATEEADVSARLAPFEHLGWDAVVAEATAAGARLVELQGVDKSAAAAAPADPEPDPEPDLEPDKVDAWLRRHSGIFQQAVDGITDVAHVPGTSESAIVRVTGRSFPERAALDADAEGRERSRSTLARQRQFQRQIELQDPARVKLDHDLALQAEGQEPAEQVETGA